LPSRKAAKDIDNVSMALGTELRMGERENRADDPCQFQLQYL